MKRQFKILVVLITLISSSAFGQRAYKELMKDNSVNFYEVCEVADAYFETIDKHEKGSGWMGYQRWKYANESKYYPSGNRSEEDPYFVKKAFEKFIKETPSTTEKYLFDDGWEEVGPASIDSITGHYSAGLGRVETFYVNPDDSDRMYFGSRSGGFWASDDGGTTWDGGSTDFLFASGVNAMTVSPTDVDHVLINLRNAGNGVTHGIYRSTDGGDNWLETNYNPVILDKGGLGSNFSVRDIAYHPTIPDLVFVCASDGLYRSTDDLATWVKVTSGSISQIEFHPTDPDIIYIYDYYYWGANKNKVLRSTDNGITFTGSAEIVGNSNNTNVHLDVSPICDDCLYFVSSNGIWISYDSGVNFTFRSSPGMSSEGFAVSDVDTTRMTIGSIDAFASDDGGITFDQVTWWGLWAAPFDGDQYIHADMREAECISGNFYMATDGFFAKSTDNGTTWEKLNHETGIRENYTLGVSQSNHYRTIVGSQDNGTSIKLQSGWIEYAGADGMEGIVHPLNDDWMIGSYQNGTRRRTFDGGQTQGNASPPGHSSSWVAPMIYDPNDHMTVFHFGEDVHRSLDFGSTWEVMGSPGFIGTTSEASIAQNNSNIMIASRGQQIYRSADAGVTWANIQGTLPSYSITYMAFDPTDDNTIVVTYNRYQDDGSKVYITHDSGSTWTNITANLNDMPIRCVVIDHTAESNIYLGAEIGVYVKEMGDTDWELYNEDLPNCMVAELEVMNGSNTLRAATWGRGVWEYALKGRAPNPAIVKTWITDPPTFTTPAEESPQYVTSQITYDWDVESAVVRWSIDAPTFENTIDMENVADSTWVSVEPLPDFPSGTKVYFKVRANGAFSDFTETYKFMYTVRPYEYCESYGNMSWGTAVTLVDFNDLNNPSGKPAPYSSYIDLDTANLYTGLTYDFSMNLATDGAFTIHANAWIDWNRDGDFEDPGEDYDLGTAYDTDDGVTTLSPLAISVPADAHLGKTTMRVSAKYNSDAGPCDTGYDGEVEDYTVFIKPYIDLDFEIVESEICVGDKIHFEYTGTPLDDILWTFTNDIDTYTSNEMIDSLILESAGTYTLSMTGYEGELTSSGSWPSVVTVHPAYHDSIEMAICNGEEYVLGTQVITESGEYIEPFATVHGCDSIVTLTMEILDVNVTVTAGDYELMANETGVTYQWLDCDADWAVIDAATDQSFTPTENGSYAVIIDDGDCIDTSDCHDIVALTLTEYNPSNIKVYPNPTSGSFVINWQTIADAVQLDVYDVSGRLVYKATHYNVNEVGINLEVAKGVYYIALQGLDEEQTVIKLLVD
ncbi:MAG: photosystem II stability/assembly factor-like uncharacterized protein [Crocinitomix sp.]|jgi:photosystem II stability/assembly factor-like uncharacterized protein